MEKLRLNESPVRTTENYGINDIELDVNIPEVLEEYDDVKFDSKFVKRVDDFFIASNIGIDIDSNYALEITIPENEIVKDTIRLKFNLSEDLIDAITINAKSGSKANIVIEYVEDKENKIKKENNKDIFHLMKQSVIAEENSEIDIQIINFANKNTESFLEIETEVKENAKVNHTIVDFGGKKKISNYKGILTGNLAENNINTIYLGKDNDILDINYCIEEYGLKTKSNIEVQGALKDKAKKNFKGTIDFKEGCQKSVGLENENCILLSKESRSKSLPMLLCHEEDVEGAHGVSSGKVDEEKVFYLMTRGITRKDAEKLIIKANFNKIIELIKDEDIKEYILKEIDNL